MTTKTRHMIFIALGSNLGDRRKNLQEASKAISMQVGEILSASHIYETEPWGYQDQPDFYNQVLEVETSLSPSEVMEALLSVEKSMGRTRSIKNGSRLIDLDILFYGDQTINHTSDEKLRRSSGSDAPTTTPHLVIPHPQIEKRRFILIPLDEIAPEMVHPLSGKTIRTLLHECTDNLQVRAVGMH